MEVIEQGEHSTVIVLADGLGSGVKSEHFIDADIKDYFNDDGSKYPIEECVSTVAATLPICSERGVAYSTFTIIRLVNNEEAEIIQFDNPLVILLREGKNYEMPYTILNIGGKNIYSSRIKLQENDIFIAMSDGCIHAAWA